MVKATERHAPAFCQYLAATAVGTKYGNVRSESLADSRSFASKLERRTYETLRLREKAGDISDLETQVSIVLGPNKRRWIMDFRFRCGGWVYYADAKGIETDRWKHLLDLWAIEGPGPLEVWKANSRGEPVLAQTIERKETTT